MINGDRNNWTARKNLSRRFRIAIPFAKWRIWNMSDMWFWKTTRFPRNFVLKSFWGRLLWIWHRIFGIQNGGHNILETNDIRGTLYPKVFEVADYEFDIGFSEFKMADPIWRTWYFGIPTIFVELCAPRFLRSLITNLTSDFRNSKWRTQYGRHNILETQWFSRNFVLKGFWDRWLRIWHRIFIIRKGGYNMVYSTIFA